MLFRNSIEALQHCMKTNSQITKKVREAKKLLQKDPFKAIKALLGAMDELKQLNKGDK